MELMSMNKNYYLLNAHGVMVFNPEYDLYEGTDGNIYIGSEQVRSFDDIKKYLSYFDFVQVKNRQGDYEDVNKDAFLKILELKYDGIIKDQGREV